MRTTHTKGLQVYEEEETSDEDSEPECVITVEDDSSSGVDLI